ncbi:MAG: PD-(D/E)XK nuclease domain-containing protein [Bacteroidota bacterium]|nr:PD-(D/E)XK nuclease domain-containing protein [Bacteroidota bacterium]
MILIPLTAETIHEFSQRYGVVIEIKQTEKQKTNEKTEQFKKRVNKAIDTALNQIERNEYYTELIINKIKPENIIKLAIVFAGKEPYINKLAE